MTNTIEIRTNGHHRELQSVNDLPQAVVEEFDYLDEEEHYTPRLVQYRGVWYDVFEMMVTHSQYSPGNDTLRQWDAYDCDTFFSGIVVRFVDDHDYETVQIGTFFSKTTFTDENE
jgi:hypothetical protein